MMGSQIALRLALKGHKVTVFNRDTSKIEKLLTQHTNGTTNLKMAHKPKELGDTSDIAIICVKDYQAITNVSKSQDASSSGLTLPTTATAEALYRASEAFGLSMKDYTSVASFISKLNGFNTFQTTR